MTPKQILIVVIRLTVIVWAVNTLSAAIPIITLSSNEGMGFPLSEILTVSGIYGTAWLFLWFFPAAVANFLLPKIHEQAQELPKNPAPWLTTGLVLIGFYTLSAALPDLAHWYFFTQMLGNEVGRSGWSLLNDGYKADIVATIVQTLTGLVLIFGAPFIGRQIRKHL